jgi:adenylate cyclase
MVLSMTEPSHAVFVSYASQDAEAAQKICEALRAAGIEVWFDQSELRGGDAWDRKIRQQVHDCRLFIAVISAHTEARDEGYFRREWKLAVDRTHDMAEGKAFLVPVVIDSTTERGASVPEKFRELQWTRLPGGETPPAFIERVGRLLSPEALPARAAATTVPTGFTTAERSRKPVLPPWRSKPALWAIGAVLAVALSYFVVDKIWLSKRTAAVTASTGQPSVIAPKRSIAVLPFVDLSEKHDQEYFADGMAEEVIDLLAKLPDLHVVGRTSSFQFRGKATDVRSIGAALNVAYVLEGSVRRSGDQIRVTAQLLSGADGTHRWSDTYEAKFEDIFKVQDSIAADLARNLQVSITTLSRNDPLAAHPEAYDLFLKGMQALDIASEEGANRAVALLGEVVRLEPRSPRALATLAYAYSVLGSEGWMAPTEAFGTARRIALKALALDGQNAMAHVVVANVAAIFEWNWTDANRELTTALSLSDRDSVTLVNAAQIASAQGHWDQAHQYVSEALAKDPLFADAYMALGAWVHLRTGKYADAESALRRGLQIRPHWGTGQYFLATCLLMQGRLSEAIVEAQRETPRDGRYQASSAIFFAMQRQKDSDEALRQAIAESGSDWPSSIAKLYAFRNERDKALEWLKRAYEFRDEDLYWIKGDPLLKNLESDPRYRAFLRNMNLPE